MNVIFTAHQLSQWNSFQEFNPQTYYNMQKPVQIQAMKELFTYEFDRALN